MNASLFPSVRDTIVRVSFKDGDIFRLRACIAIDETIYAKKGLWSGEIVEVVNQSNEKFQFGINTGFDFSEEDIAEIFDEASHQIIFSRNA